MISAFLVTILSKTCTDKLSHVDWRSWLWLESNHLKIYEKFTTHQLPQFRMSGWCAEMFRCFEPVGNIKSIPEFFSKTVRLVQSNRPPQTIQSEFLSPLKNSDQYIRHTVSTYSEISLNKSSVFWQKTGKIWRKATQIRSLAPISWD